MLFGYSRGIKNMDISYTEFQPGGSFQTDKDSWTLFPAASGGTEPFLSCSCSPVRSQLAQIRAGHGLLSSLVGLELALDMQNHQAVVTVILIDCHTLGTQQDRDSDLIYLSEVALRWTHARTIFHFSGPSRAPLLFCVASPTPSSLLPLGAAAPPSHPCAIPYLQQVCPSFLHVDVSRGSPSVWEELYKWVSNWGHWRQLMQ